MTLWRSLLLIYPTIDVRLRLRPFHSTRFEYALSDQEVRDAIESFQQFPALVEDLASGRVGIRYQIEPIERSLTSLTLMGKDMYWPSPDDTREEIDQLASPGTHDSLFILWPQHSLKDDSSVPSGGWGLAIGASRWSNQATYAAVANAESWKWRVPVPGEVWLHEWLHGVCAFFAARGYSMPDGDADGGARHGYTQSPASGWTDYYRDLMTGKVLCQGRQTGIPLDAWQHRPELTQTA
jgi:hypothetical protein